MARDPLSVAATVLPESSFDPVQYAKERTQTILQERADQRTRYNEAWNSVPSPVDVNRNVYTDLIKRRNDLLKSGATSMADGVDVTDITNPKSASQAIQFRDQLNQLTLEAAKTLNLDKMLGETRKAIAEDQRKGTNAINVQATTDRIKQIQNAGSMKEIDDMLSSWGDNLIELNRQPMDINKMVTDNLVSSNILPMEKETQSLEGGKEVTRKFKEMDPEKLRGAMVGMYNTNPKLREEIKYARQNDPTDVKGGSDLEYFMERYGNPRLRQQTYEGRKIWEPKKTDKPDEKLYQASSEPVTTQLGRYKVIGRNVYTFKQEKPIELTVPQGTINMKTSGEFVDAKTKLPVRSAGKFIPINTAEYNVLTKDVAGFKKGTIITDVDIKKGTRFKKGDYQKKRYVEGTFETKEGQATILVPYDDVKNELDVQYQMASEVDKNTNNSDPLGIL